MLAINTGTEDQFSRTAAQFDGYRFEPYYFGKVAHEYHGLPVYAFKTRKLEMLQASDSLWREIGKCTAWENHNTTQGQLKQLNNQHL